MIQDLTQHIGVLTVSIHIPDARSLKAKRMVVKSLKSRVRAKFNVSVAELAGQDKWQVATFGFVMISSDQRYVDSCLQHLLSFIESFGNFYICEQQIDYY